MISLDMAEMQAPYIVSSVECPESGSERLQSMGFVAGAPLRVLSCLEGNLIVAVMDARFALSQEQAKNIFVEELNGHTFGRSQAGYGCGGRRRARRRTRT